jgi:hypothetical protein
VIVTLVSVGLIWFGLRPRGASEPATDARELVAR